MYNQVNLSSFVLLLWVSFAHASPPIYHYDPATVELTGTLEIQTFPGAPNYESIQDGDEIEQGWYLRLKEPIDVVANEPATDLGWKTERNVRILQMAVHSSEGKDNWKKLKVGKTVTAKGKLFNPVTGHHHSRVLISVNEIRNTQ